MGGLLPLVLYLALLQCHAAEGLTETSSACFGQTAASCARLNMTCSGQEKVFVVTALYGSKPFNSACPSEVAYSFQCQEYSDCCRASGSDSCFRNYTASHFQTLFHTCREEDVCRASADRNKVGCGNSYARLSSFVRTSFVCIEEANVRQVEVGSSASFSAGAAAAVRFSQGQQQNSSSSSGEWRCLVESRPGSSSGGSTELLLVRGPGSSGGGPGAVDRARETTPFYINLSVLQEPETWAVMYASEGTSLQVTCGSSDTPVSSGSSDTPVSSGTMAAAVISVYVLLAVAAVFAIVLMRRYGFCHKGKPASGVPSSARDPDANNIYLEAIPDPIDASPRTTPSHVYVNAASDQTNPTLEQPDNNYLRVIPDPSDLSPRTNPSHLHVNEASDLTNPTLEQPENNYLQVIPDPSDLSPRTNPANVYVNAASDQAPSTSEEAGRESQHEYSPLDWSHDQSNPYTCLGNA